MSLREKKIILMIIKQGLRKVYVSDNNFIELDMIIF